MDSKEELTEMLFKLIEDIGHTEELIEEIKGETRLMKNTIKQNIELFEEKLEQQSRAISARNLENSEEDSKFEEINQKIESINNEIKNLKNLKDSIKTGKTINIDYSAKHTLKSKMTKWQMMLIGSLAIFATLSIIFFLILKDISLLSVIVYIVFAVPFCMAMYFFNDHLKKIKNK